MHEHLRDRARLELQPLGDDERDGRGRRAARTPGPSSTCEARGSECNPVEPDPLAVGAAATWRASEPLPDDESRAATAATQSEITMISEACGTPTSLIPLSTRMKANAKRSERSGTLIDIWLPSSTPGIDPTSSQPIACRSTLPCSEMAEPGDPEQRGRVGDVRADDLLRRQREEEQHREPEERPGADRRQADDEAARPRRSRSRRSCRAARRRTARRRRRPCRNVFARKPSPPRISAAPTILPIVDRCPRRSCSRSARRRATAAPSRAASRARAARARCRASGGAPPRTT